MRDDWWAASGTLTLTLSQRERKLTAASCPTVASSSNFMIAYGALTAGGTPALPGSVVEAKNAGGVTVGCSVTNTGGTFGAMYVYG